VSFFVCIFALRLLIFRSVIARLASAPFNSEHYEEKLSQLQQLSQKRARLRQKLELYKHVKKQMECLDNPQNAVQPHIVTKDSGLAEELAKSKMLSTRVAGRVAGTKRSIRDLDEEQPFEIMNTNEKLKRAFSND
jgi:cell shape-determining protein MreC